jgi:hypothetical protein
MHHRFVTHARHVTVAALLAAASTARAECPTTPDDPVCRPWSAVLLPTAFGAMYAPHGLDGQFYGGGLEAVLLAWSDNSAAFGPSQGRVRLDVSYLTGTAMDAGAMVMYRGGAQVAFERNASRAYAIPYFAADLGGLWSDATGRRWYADAGVGLYLVHLRGMVLDLEVTGVLPFRDPETLGGLSTRLGLSFALW